jgi:hypothetical protein
MSVQTALQKAQVFAGAEDFPHSAMSRLLQEKFPRLDDGSGTVDIQKLCALEKPILVDMLGSVGVNPDTVLPLIQLALQQEVPSFKAFPDSTRAAAVDAVEHGGHRQPAAIHASQKLLEQVDMSGWTPPPSFRLPKGHAPGEPIQATRATELVFCVFSDIAPMTGVYPTTKQKLDISKACEAVISSGDIVQKERMNPRTMKPDPAYDWGHWLIQKKAKCLGNSVEQRRNYHRKLVIYQEDRENTNELELETTRELLKARTDYSFPTGESVGFGWTVSPMTRLEARAQQQAEIDKETKDLAATKQAATARVAQLERRQQQGARFLSSFFYLHILSPQLYSDTYTYTKT